MLRRSALLALPAIVAVGGAAVTLQSKEAAADVEVVLAAGADVQAAAPASVVDAGAALPQQAPPAARPGTRSQVIKDVLPSSVRVSLTDPEQKKTFRVASGVILGFGEKEDGEQVGYVMTNAHVVEARPPVHIDVLVDRKGDTRSFRAELVAVGEVPQTDLALLEVPGLVGEPAQLAENADFELGDEVVAVGAPFGKGISISSGIVSQLDWDEIGAARGFKTDAPIGYGASGGGIFRVPDGKLLAVIEGYRTAKVSIPVAEKKYSFDVPMPGETFASPAAKVRAFLKSRGVAHLLPSLFPGEELAAPQTAATTAAR